MPLGFVVHVPNPLNMDIDLGLTQDELIYYHLDDVEHVTYEYMEDGELHTGMAYRTRLEGIANRKDRKRSDRLVSDLLQQLHRFLDRTGGFVKYEISGVDIFKRAIIRLYDPVSGVELNELILSPKYAGMYERYPISS